MDENIIETRLNNTIDDKQRRKSELVERFVPVKMESVEPGGQNFL